MDDKSLPVNPEFRAVLAEKLADSALGRLPDVTPRRHSGLAQFPGKATAVIGMRRAGKTFFLHQLRAADIAGGVAPRQLPYVNFEDDRLLGMDSSGLAVMLEMYYRENPDLRGGDARVLWCLDEVQVVPGWQLFVRRLLDAEKTEVAITGSSAAMLSREIATSLRGRAWTVKIFPFSFDEALRHAGLFVPDGRTTLSSAKRTAVEAQFLEYLKTGGFPEAQGRAPEVRWQLLRDYVDVAVLRDVVERHAVTNVAGLRWLVRHLLGNAGGLFSVEKFHAALKSSGISVGRDTLHEYVAHVQDCFLVRTVWMESASERQRMVNPRKVYPIDPGLIPLYDRSGRSNLGHALETVVLLELERRGAEITYVRTPEGYEVDFLARHTDGSSELIQVCADALDPQTATREIRALDEAARVFPGATPRLLTATQTGFPSSLPPAITAEPAWQWIVRG
ncbi:MAG TPA: ATP-binding protein [Myxococcota bacterium]|nr:ATP-binding protein [Myxococcota bacterium]HNZ03761.1 ATP-binding protein [Myxococcota bacterium]HOD06739.1 ATP-binding protein [Myxococcota bacterium]HPB50889.1 ATP-binding protein [Myxococcota bacterium]HQP95375.1 ATP-binding protein [Myxococcota bacterium]